MTTLSVPAAHWHEPPTLTNAGFSTLAPYRTADGYWVFLPVLSMPPAGDTRGALVAFGDFTILTTSTTLGRAIRRNGVGTLFFR